MEPIDWEALARRLGTIVDQPNGRSESGGTDLAKAAVSTLLGEEEIRRAVAHYVGGRPGSELVRSVLWLLRPAAARDECYRIYRESSDPETRIAAIELLRVVADASALHWLDEFLDDPLEGVALWGIGMLDQLVMADLVDAEAAEPWLVRAEVHRSEPVRERADFIRALLERRS